MVEAQAQTIATLEASMANTAGLEATVNDIDQSLMDMATCMAGYASDTSDMPEETEAPEPETSMMSTTTTKMPSMAPTTMASMWESQRDVTLDEVVCSDEKDENGNDLYRTFKEYVSVEVCADMCAMDVACMYFSHRSSNNNCIGCSIVPDLDTHNAHQHYNGYKMVMKDSRRQLSELETLRAENAALKEALARRN